MVFEMIALEFQEEDSDLCFRRFYEPNESLKIIAVNKERHQGVSDCAKRYFEY